ncbi:hypothetical protein GmHk_08G021064 [Glycine max]|nr:hypothetical protein GmHk_08G021064 [Glycine max]
MRKSNKDREEEEGGGSSLESEGPVPEAKTETPISDGNGISFDNQSEIFRAIEVVERDSLAIFSLRFPPFGPLRIHLHLTPSHAVLHRCHRLDEEMKSVDGLASQLYPITLPLRLNHMIIFKYFIQGN